MEITFDPAKNARNIAERRLPFEQAANFDFSTALIQQDERRPYPEPRFVAIGLVDQRLHVLCFTPTEAGIRVISFRKANPREIKAHEDT